MAAKTQTQANKESNELILYRLGVVEAAVRDVGTKVDKQDNIKKADLIEFRETIVSRITDMRVDLQRQLDDKAEKAELSDLKKLVYGVGAFLGTLFSGAFLYLLSRGH